MAIDDLEQSGNQSAARAPETAARTASHRNQAGRGQGTQGGFRWNSIASVADQPMGWSPASEVLTKLTKSLDEKYQNISSDAEIRVLPMDLNNNPRLRLSLIVVCMTRKGDPQAGVGYHTLILEGSAEPFQDRLLNIGGQQVADMIVAGDAYDNNLNGIVREEVKRVYGDNVYLVDGSAAVVPRDFDVNDNGLVHTLAVNSIYACNTYMKISDKSFPDINLAGAENDTTLTARVQFNNINNNTTQDAVGLPVRNDIEVTLTAGDTQQNNQNPLGSRPVTISKVGGFLDLVWDPLAPQGQNFFGMQAPQAQNQPTQLWQPNLVLTTLSAADLQSPPMQLLALINAMSLVSNNAWVGAFRPKSFAAGGVDYHDIGAIGYELLPENGSQFGKKIETHTDKFLASGEFFALMRLAIRTDLLVSIDVPECGASTWQNDLFGAAGAGSAQAQADLIKAANQLTNGKFDSFWNQSMGAIASDAGNRIHLGYYIDQNGVKRDLREIDYLFIANMFGDRDPNLIRKWSDTFTDTTIPLEKRLDDRRQILENMLSNVVFTGFARRVTLSSDFLMALVQAAAACGFSARTVFPHMGDQVQDRAVGSLSNFGIKNAGNMGVFHTGMSGGNSFSNNRPGRW